MEVVLLMIVTFVGYIAAYHTYGRFLAKKIFKLDDSVEPPSVIQEDGVDYVPTDRGIIFGHHYTSIAGTGPIVGPAIGIIWGWVPALVWVFVGSVVMGAVHDFGSVVVSMRHRGKSMSECAGEFLGPRVKYIFFIIIFLLLLIVIAIFGMVIAAIFKIYPESVFPVWMQIPIAVGLGWAIYSRKWNVTACTVVAVLLMYATIVMGTQMEVLVSMTPTIQEVPTGTWVVVLLAYVFLASSLSVKTLLQPRDYINAWQLFVAMGLMVLGIFGSGLRGTLSMAAPAVNLSPEGAPPMLPFLFITIACGAISGFHSLVASGTTSKQIRRETDAQFVGYGSMLLEAALATLVIIAVGAGIGIAYETASGETLTGVAAWSEHYRSWQASMGLGSKLSAMVIGSANMMQTVGVPKPLGIIIMGVFIASFAGTTLDTATRIQRYVVSELFAGTRLTIMTNRYVATGVVVLSAAWLAFATGADGKGALTLWPMFGAGNQLLAALALLVVTNYLRKQGGYGFLVAGIPCIIMLTLTAWAVIVNERKFVSDGNWLLGVMNGLVIVLAVWMVAEGLLALFKTNSNRTGENT